MANIVIPFPERQTAAVMKLKKLLQYLKCHDEKTMYLDQALKHGSKEAMDVVMDQLSMNGSQAELDALAELDAQMEAKGMRTEACTPDALMEEERQGLCKQILLC